jgi:hypothetical protein
MRKLVLLDKVTQLTSAEVVGAGLALIKDLENCGEGKLANKSVKTGAEYFLPLVLPVVSGSKIRMSALWRPLSTSFKPSNLTYRHLVVPTGCRRSIASVAPNAGEGPLAGLRVLDMTRVLAGVRRIYVPA